jgi:hypothetical protein
MFRGLGRTRVVAPDGVEWQVGRRWVAHRRRWSRARAGEIATESLNGLGSGWPDMGNLDLGHGLLIVAVIIAVVVVLIPILFFGVELIVLGVLVAAGVIGRTVLRQPWVVEATSYDPLASSRRLEWRVRGWRRSRKLITDVASDLSAGRAPSATGDGEATD